MQLIGEMFNNTVKAYADKSALIFEASTWSYATLNEKINRLATSLMKLDIGRGARVLVQLKNGPEIIIAHHAIIRAGAIIVPLNVMYVAHEITYIGNDTEAQVIILDEDFLPLLDDIRSTMPHLKTVIVVGNHAAAGAIRFQDLISASDEQNISNEADFNDIVSIIYTSGTTGRPKGATQTHRSILTSVQALCDFNKFTYEDRLLCALPLFNNFGINVIMMSAFYSGSTLIVVDRFEGVKVLENMTEHQATYFAGTPTMYVYLLQAYDPAKHNLSALRVVNCGGAHCPSELIDTVEKTFGVTFMDGYGQTEACGFTTLNPIVGIRKKESVGVPIANIWVKIVDDNFAELPAGEVGEILQKGDVFSVHGYWRRPEINAETYRDDWFCSGDLGYIDPDGYLYVVDRKQDLIITGGQNIYPVEIEEILYTHPAVALAAVIGVPDKIKGELAKAYIVLKEGRRTTEDQIIEYVKSKIAKFKAPRMVEFVDALPQGPTGKILKRELRAMI
ncbi:MAG: long-chain-fatty-acid--CoA ligase [Deltaproteobacteria bacterium]|jgi:long-chain acyl-CoA synthetase|nr:long-chain-fatty-acid--CoA ligase [Deltaproteobacteria bacterium]